MRLLSALCLVVSAVMVAGQVSPGAPKSNALLYGMQKSLANVSLGMWPDGENWESSLNMAIGMASGDLCKIKKLKQQKEDSVMIGQKCKDEFSRLYNENECSGGICDMIAWIRDNSREVVYSLITARTEKAVFDIVEREIYVPLMEWACECATDMMDAWMECKDGIGEAKIWNLLRMTGTFDTSADYLGGQDFKAYWEDFIVNQIPWDSISTFLERMMANLCQESGKNKEQCYDYFFDTATKLYQWYINTISRKETPAKLDGYPGHCSKFDLSVLGSVDFTSIKEAVVNKFCVEDCSGLYQDVLLGCCTASIIQDEELEQALEDIAMEAFGMLDEFLGDGGSDMFDIEMIMDYAEDIMAMLRNPTCENTAVEYELLACGEDSSSGGSGGSCEQLKSQWMALKMQIDSKCSGDGGDPCAGLSGREKMVCKRKQAKEEDSKETSGGDGGDPCAGLSGREKMVCKRKQAKKETSGGRGGGGGKRGGGGRNRGKENA